MATSRMRHVNSPEELAKREASGPAAPPQQRQGFRHHNSPEERARRGEAVASAAVVVPPPRRLVQAPPVLDDWPPRGEANNAPAGPPQAARRPPDATTAPTGLAGRVAALEAIVYRLVESPADAADLRMQVSNLGAVVESQRELGNRLRVVEQQVDTLNDEVETLMQPGAPVDAEPAADDVDDAPDEAAALPPKEGEAT